MARFKLIGAEIQGQDVNERTPTRGEQVTDPNEAVVYETDDQVEARTIMDAGGFFRDRDNFIAVTRLVDSQATRDQPDTPFFRPSTFPQKGN